jgi:hypothetical protein
MYRDACWLRPIMRRVFLAGSFLALVAALVLLWTHRFERVPGIKVWSLADLRAGVPDVPGVEWTGTADDPGLRLEVDGQTPRVALRLVIPGAPALDMLHLRYHMAADGLTPGKEKWDVGRMMIEWHPVGTAGEVEQDPVGGAKLDEKFADVTLIARPEIGPARPSLRLEHLGLAGSIEVSDLEIMAVRDRELWKTGRWFLACGWLAWLAACIGPYSSAARWRVLAAAAIWLVMGIQFVVPGPWKIEKPLIAAFALGGEADGPSSGQAPPSMASSPNSEIASGAVASSGKIPVRGGLALRIKQFAAQARPLLHVLLLMAPVFASALLVGRKPTLFLAVLLSIAIEGAQIAFGYGFDWLDVLDLMTDAAGIVLGLWLVGCFTRLLQSRKERPS